MNSSKAAIAVSAFTGKLLSILGYVIGTFFFIIIIACLADMKSEGAVEALIFSIVMFGISVLAVLKGRKRKLRIKRFKTYVGLISAEHMTYIENLAGSTSNSVDFVKKDLQEMIDKKFFSNAYIDSKTNEIIIGGPISQNTVSSNMQSSQIAADIDTENVKCPGCGAVNSRRKGTVIHCEYCGTPLE